MLEPRSRPIIGISLRSGEKNSVPRTPVQFDRSHTRHPPNLELNHEIRVAHARLISVGATFFVKSLPDLAKRC
jgi:hypothetical protein